MNPVFGGSESARQPFRPIRPFTEADRPNDGDSALAAALNNANAAISQDPLPPAPALAYGHASDPPYNACSSPDSIAVGPVVPVVPAAPAVQKPRVLLKKSATSEWHGSQCL